MNYLIEQNAIIEMTCGNNFSYILGDSSIFSVTEYKVLQSQADSCFVKCMKMMYNGKVQLYYLTQSMKPFMSMISSLDAEGFLTIVSNLFSNIIEVNYNGFLSCQNVDIAFHHIFVDPATYKVRLVYVPASRRLYQDNAIFENEIRTELIKLISNVSGFSTMKMTQLLNCLSNGRMTLEDIYHQIKVGNRHHADGIETNTTKEKLEKPEKTGHLRMIDINNAVHSDIIVTKDNFVIGKKEVCDAVIPNNMISRLHCKVNQHGKHYTVTDLQSANGTYVNRTKLQPNQPYAIKDGDVIRLANVDFRVVVE